MPYGKQIYNAIDAYEGIDMYLEAQNTVKRNLWEGERLVWMGCPNVARFAVRKSWNTFLFGIPFTAFSLFWEYNAASKGLFFQLWGIPFIAVGFGMLASPLWQYWRGQKTIYAVTNQRLLIITGGIFPSVKSFTPSDVDDIERQESPDGSGTIIFARKKRSGGKGGAYTVKIGFFAIPDVRKVERFIVELTKREQ